MPLLSTDELVRDLRARRIMVDGGNGNVYIDHDVADEVCEQAADLIEKPHDVYAVIERAEQACRYMLKHNEDRWSREERSEDYAQGFKIACELCAEAIKPHVMRHEGEAAVTLARRFTDFIARSGNIATDQVVRLRKEFEAEFDPGRASYVEDLEYKIALVMAHDSNLIDYLVEARRPRRSNPDDQKD